MSVLTDQDLAVIDRHEQAEAAHDVPAIMATFAEDAVMEPKPLGVELIGRGEIEGFYRDLVTGFPDVTLRLVHRYHDGPTVIDELVLAGTHAGPFLGMPATGRAVEVAVTIIYEVHEGLLTREAAYWDGATMLVQMGVLPAPGGPAESPAR